MPFEGLTIETKNELEAGMAFLAGLLSNAGIAYLNIDNQAKTIAWDIKDTDAGADLQALFKLFAEVENHYLELLAERSNG